MAWVIKFRVPLIPPFNSFNSFNSHSSYQATKVKSDSRLFSNKEIQQRVSSVAESLIEHELETLCDEYNSRELFGISFPLFIKVPAISNQATKQQAVKSNDGVNRWTWKFEFVRDGFSYAICTQWYPKNLSLGTSSSHSLIL